MRVTVIPADNKIIVDGVALEMTFECDTNIHAIQWYGDHGTIEKKVGGAEAFDDVQIVQPFIDAHSVESVRISEAAEVAPE